ncbi:hypothetical protein GmarT_38300 [Gimesia maris]|uniref:Uncharacterized protein n=2 Tax=Gimesia maris TaxID=122 RepID=A0ABX5YQK1_9PLAN|nr:hypothetical protein GmarT_38300 [Gimesia maris]
MNGSPTATPDSQSEEQKFRYRRNCLYQGLCCFLGFAGMMLFSCYFLLTDPAMSDGEYYMLLCSIVFWLFWTTGSVWMILAYYFASLTIQGNKLIEQGVLLRKELDLESIRQLRWITSPSGMIKLKSLTEKITIHLENFPCEEQIWIMEYLRAQIPEPDQEGWDLFCHRVAMPLRRYDPQALPVPDNDQVLLTRKRWDWLLLPWILLFSVGGVLATLKFNQPHLLSAPLSPTALWLFLRFSTPKEGMVSKVINANKELRSFLFFTGGMLLTYLTILVGLKFIDSPLLDNNIFMACLTLIGMAAMLWKCHRLDKNQYKKQLEASKASVEEWEAGSSPQITDRKESRL